MLFQFLTDVIRPLRMEDLMDQVTFLKFIMATLNMSRLRICFTTWLTKLIGGGTRQFFFYQKFVKLKMVGNDRASLAGVWVGGGSTPS